MSKIMQELLTATGVKAKRGEADQDLRARIVEKVNELDDAAWNKLSTDAQDYCNDAADALNDGKDLPDFPDVEKTEAKPAASSRRGAAAKKEEPAVAVPAVGDQVTVVTKRGQEYTGELLEVDGDVIVVDVDGEEKEFTKDRVQSVTIVASEDGEDTGADGDYEPQVGDAVVAVTKRGKTYEGEVVEVDDDLIVLDVDGSEEELQRSRLESITLAGEAGGDGEEDGDYEPEVDDEVVIVTKRNKTIEGKVVEIDGDVIVVDVDGSEEELQRSRLESITRKEAKPAASSRRGAAAKTEAKPAASSRRGAAAKTEGKAPRITSKTESGVSAPLRMRQLICEDQEASVEDIGKALKKEGLAFKDNTLKLVYTDVHKILGILKGLKKLK